MGQERERNIFKVENYLDLTMSYQKYEIDGKIGVVISSDFGAGWSTWCSNSEIAERMLFDAEIVKLILAGKEDEAKDYVLTFAPYVYVGADKLTVLFISKGVAFSINDYDGCESVYMSIKLDWVA